MIEVFALVAAAAAESTGWSGWTIGWLLWLGMFLAIEGAALVNKKRGDTLSEHVWNWFAIKNKPKGYRWRRFVFLAFWAWLSIHFFTGGWV